MERGWEDVWERKGREALSRGASSLVDLVRADGFDTPTGSISLDDWRARGGLIRRLLHLGSGRPPLRVLEVGCGAGAMLVTLQGPDVELSGVDSSAALVEVARRALPAARVEVAAAAALPFPDRRFDGVFAHSVFAYFPSLEYAAAALEEMHRVAAAGAPVFVLDVPDADLREASERARAALLEAEPGGAAQLNGPRHLYVPRALFAEAARRQGRRVTFLDERVASHPMSAFRYHALLEPER